MNTTHAAMGVTLAAPLVAVAPELAPVAALAGFAGGVFPDLDVVAGEHRKTLHFPVYYSAAALATSAALLVEVVPAATAVAAVFFLLSAALHSITDAAGGGLELRPWEPSDERGVYLHPSERWVAPRRWIRWDGAPEDLLLAAVLSVPGLVLFGEDVRTLTLVGLGVSVVYTAFRKQLPDWDVPILR